MNLLQIKTIDVRSKNTVFGFIRESQSLFDTETQCYIPDVVGYIVLMYCYIAEYFTVYGSNIEYNQSTNTIKYISSCHGQHETAYGNINIDTNDNCIHRWTLRIINDECYEIFIGIDSSNKSYINDQFYRRYVNTSS